MLPLRLRNKTIPWTATSRKPLYPAARTFNSTCAGCHGLDGRGSDKGANIAGSVSVRRLSDADVSAIISKGVPGTGMPAFHNLSARQIGLVSQLFANPAGQI